MRKITSKEDDESENPLQSEIQALSAAGKIHEGVGPIGPPVDASNEYSGGVYRRREPLMVDSPESAPDLNPGQGDVPPKQRRPKRTTTERTSPLPPPGGTMRPPEDDNFYDHILPTMTPGWYDPYEDYYFGEYETHFTDSTVQAAVSGDRNGPRGPIQPAVDYPIGRRPESARPGLSGQPGMRQPPPPDSDSPGIHMFDAGSKGTSLNGNTRNSKVPSNSQAESGT